MSVNVTLNATNMFHFFFLPMEISQLMSSQKAPFNIQVLWKLTHVCARLLIDEREHHVLFSLIETFVDEGSNQSSDGRLVKWDEIKYSYWIAKGQTKIEQKLSTSQLVLFLTLSRRSIFPNCMALFRTSISLIHKKNTHPSDQSQFVFGSGESLLISLVGFHSWIGRMVEKFIEFDEISKKSIPLWVWTFKLDLTVKCVE